MPLYFLLRIICIYDWVYYSRGIENLLGLRGATVNTVDSYHLIPFLNKLS